MIIRPRHLLPLVAVALGLGAVPAAAVAQTGGVEVGETVINASPTYLGQAVRFDGRLAASAAGHAIEIQALGADGAWTPVTTTRAGGDGRFTARWRATTVGRYTVRAQVSADVVSAQAGTAPVTTATVYRRAGATWYDQAGSTGACGVKLRKRTIGLAHRTLPCGTKVEMTYRGRTLTVPVVDRGPFVRGVHYDLTLQAAKILGFVHAGRVRLGVLPATEATPASPIAAVPPAAAPAAGGGVAARNS